MFGYLFHINILIVLTALFNQLWITNNLLKSLKSYFNQLLSSKKLKIKSTGYYTFEHSPSYIQQDINNYFDSTCKYCTDNKIKHVILPTKCIYSINHDGPKISSIKMLCNTISGSIILDLYSQDHFEPTIALIKTLFKHSQTKTKIGISLHKN